LLSLEDLKKSLGDYPLQRKGEKRTLKPYCKVLRRLKLVESQPSNQRQTLLKTIDTI